MILQFMFVFFSFLLVIIAYTISNERFKRRKNFPPGPIGLPIVGCLFQLLQCVGLQKMQHYEKIHLISKKYGSIIAAQVGRLAAVVTEDPDLCKEVLTSPDWTCRFPSHPMFKEHILGKPLGVMWSEGEPQKEMKRFTVKTLKDFGFGELQTSATLIEEEVFDLIKTIDDIRENNNNIVPIHKLFKIPVFNVLWKVMAGYRFTHDNKDIIKLIDAVEDVSRINIGLDPEWAFPILRYIPGLSPTRNKAESFTTCHLFFIDIMNERRKTMNFMTEQKDFIDCFLKKVEEEKLNPGTYYTDEQFHVTCVDLLYGGLDTTANSFEFFILYMAKYPEVQKKVQQEIDFILADETDKFPNLLDRSKFRYSEATMWEVMRVANIVPCNSRTNSCDTVLGGYFIPKDTLCGLNISVVHKDPKVWGDPENFRPERFLDASNNLINTNKVLAFGAGRRACPGAQMTKVIWFYIVTGILQKYSIEPSPTHPELDLTADDGITNMAKPFECLIRLRKR